MKLYRTTDRIPVKIGDAVFTISPLSRHQKQQIVNAARKTQSGVTIEDAMEMAALSMKFSIKGVSGILDNCGLPWSPKFDPDGHLSDESIDELFNINEDSPLAHAMIAATNGIHKMSKVEGVEIQEVSVEKK